MLIIFGDNPDRIRSEAAFAKLCGACPIPASSGMTTGRHRLYRGGHRQANAALHRTVVVRMRLHQPTVDYVARRTAGGRSAAHGPCREPHPSPVSGGRRAAPLSHRQMRILSIGLVGWPRTDVWSAASGGAEPSSQFRAGRRRAPFTLQPNRSFVATIHGNPVFLPGSAGFFRVTKLPSRPSKPGVAGSNPAGRATFLENSIISTTVRDPSANVRRTQ